MYITNLAERSATLSPDVPRTAAVRLPLCRTATGTPVTDTVLSPARTAHAHHLMQCARSSQGSPPSKMHAQSQTKRESASPLTLRTTVTTRPSSPSRTAEPASNATPVCDPPPLPQYSYIGVNLLSTMSIQRSRRSGDHPGSWQASIHPIGKDIEPSHHPSPYRACIQWIWFPSARTHHGDCQ